MLKSEVAAIRIRSPFDDEIVEFLDAVSKIILKDSRAKKYGDVITFGFWCRKASVLQMKKQYGNLEGRIGRGLVFHIAPSNVAVNFAYSLVTGLLSGNANVVRLPSKQFEQVDLICEAINNAFESYPNISPYISFVRYGHDKNITDELSAKCDVRVIWGGNNTINEIRKSLIRPRTVDIAFADRYSIAAINAGKYLVASDKIAIAKSFYNDTYLTDQNACTSPKLIVWLGSDTEKIKNAQELFWSHLYDYTKPQYELQGVQAVHKLSKMMMIAAKSDKVKYINGPDNLICRVEVENLSEELFENCGHSGFFMEYTSESLSEILPVCSEKCQTLSYFGIEKSEIENFINKYKPKGIDRVVPIGKTMDFSLTWDGYDLINEMSRKVVII